MLSYFIHEPRLKIKFTTISWRNSAKQSGLRFENLWSTLDPTEIQPSESSQAYAYCTRVVQLAQSALIADIRQIVPDQLPS
ncbi:MAG: hypothetical protein EZS28_042518 [Streblomastix strix]|uniref:Uncharacterized protein n=1 Tax=Streblomastix strix TaxID=222440 RepID=A0A5J4TTU9_9EUKA|nr:MAG: hypothetical protein EZS28_042518 [Streblomastix strix]